MKSFQFLVFSNCPFLLRELLVDLNKLHLTSFHVIRPYLTIDSGITGRMMTVVDTDHQRACDAMIQQNYFVQTCLPPKMHLKSNAGSATAPYHVVFALDKSGSMWGTKLDQTKEAFRSMISSLDREARFSILGFNYATSPWRTRLVKASPYNVEEARGFISRLSAGGGTNMHAALIDAVEVIILK